MPGIANPAEEYFKDGLWAWDPAGTVWLKLIIDPLTNRLVIDHPGDLEVVQPTPADLCVANHGWDGLAWQKQPLMWSAPVRYALDALGTAAGAGHATATITLDIPGYVFMLQGLHYWHDAGAGNRCDGWVEAGAVSLWLFDVDAVPTNYYQTVLGEILLADDDVINARAVAPGAGKVVMMSVWGYLMSVAG